MFKIGDRVIHVSKSEWGIGIVIYIRKDGDIAVEFSSRKFNGHDCNGRIPSCKGWWCGEDEIALTEQAELEKLKLICPILTVASCSLPNPEGKKECEMDICAWFDTKNQCCIIHSLSELRNLF